MALARRRSCRSDSHPVSRRTADWRQMSYELIGGCLPGKLLGIGQPIGRSRPERDLGKKDFSQKRDVDNASFPSDLTTVAWAAVTPYAKEYDAPWLYGIAALANVGRVAERRHWFSDTVAGSFIGYGVGSLMWTLNRERQKGD